MEEAKNYTEQIEMQAKHLLAVMSTRCSESDIARIKDAYQFAREAHSSQRRKSGEPYITHPLSVATIAAEELRLDAESVIAALLHDVVEDTHYSIMDITERYGSVVAHLVKAVTKQKKERYMMSKQLDNFKQMLDSVGYDIRGILVKLADRLHNMRTLSSMAPEKQMKIAGETDFFYAPLANRLGLYNVKVELENLSLRYRCPNDYDKIEQMLNDDRQKNAKRLEQFIDTINILLSQQGIRARVNIRHRSPYSIWKKMNKTGRDFWHIDKHQSVNIIFDEPEKKLEKQRCLQIYSALSSRFKEQPGSILNLIDYPKENGYQSFHVTLLSEEGVWVEVHISSARMMEIGRLGCVADNKESNIEQWILSLKETLHDIAYNGNVEGSFMDSMSASFHHDDISVFTVEGQRLILPINATAIDFAFAADPEHALKAQCCRINGKLRSMRTVLERGDCVSIELADNAKPAESWLDCVVTYAAKQGIKSFLARQPRLKYNRCPYCNPLPGDEVIGFKEADKTVTVHKRDCAEVIRQATQYGDSLCAVELTENENILFPARIVIRATDRYHFLIEVIRNITDDLKLNICSLHTSTVDHIADLTLDFEIHSVHELRDAVNRIQQIQGVDEVRVEIARKN